MNIEENTHNRDVHTCKWYNECHLFVSSSPRDCQPSLLEFDDDAVNGNLGCWELATFVDDA